MAKVTACDGCGTTQGQFGKVSVEHTWAWDGGFFLPRTTELTLCVECSAKELTGLVRSWLPDEEKPGWVGKFQKN